MLVEDVRRRSAEAECGVRSAIVATRNEGPPAEQTRLRARRPGEPSEIAEMSEVSKHQEEDLTALLRSWRAGSEQALEALVPMVYDELRRIARAHMRGERADHTLEPTALVHQAYERLIDVQLDWRDRAHFLNMASRTMRRVLVDHARGRQRGKRGGERQRVSLAAVDRPAEHREDELAEILTLDAKLAELERIDERKAALVQAHFFGGMTYRELAEAFAVSEATVHRELHFARAWLARELGGH